MKSLLISTLDMLSFPFQRQRVMFPIEATLLDPTEYGVDAEK